MVIPPSPTSPAEQKAGEITIDSSTLSYLDLRTAPLESIKILIDDFVVAARAKRTDSSTGLCGVLILKPQPTDELLVALASQGVELLEGTAQQSLSEILGQFGESFRQTRTSWMGTPGTPDQPSVADATTAQQSSSASVFAQRPPWLNQKVFDERMRRPLRQPWSDEDISSLDY